MSEPWQEVDKKRGIEILRLIQARLDRGIQPTVRDAGLTAAEARWMVMQRLISLGDTLSWNAVAKEATAFEDRHVIFEISDEAKGHLINADALVNPLQTVQATPPAESKLVKTARWSAKTLWGWFSALVLVVLGFFAKRYLEHHYPDSSTSPNSLPSMTLPQSTNSQPTSFNSTNSHGTNRVAK